MKIEKIDFVIKKERLSACRKPQVIFEGFVVTLESKGILMQTSYQITLKEIFAKAKEDYSLNQKLKAELEAMGELDPSLNY